MKSSALASTKILLSSLKVNNFFSKSKEETETQHFDENPFGNEEGNEDHIVTEDTVELDDEEEQELQDEMECEEQQPETKVEQLDLLKIVQEKFGFTSLREGKPKI